MVGSNIILSDTNSSAYYKIPNTEYTLIRIYFDKIDIKPDLSFVSTEIFRKQICYGTIPGLLTIPSILNKNQTSETIIREFRTIRIPNFIYISGVVSFNEKYKFIFGAFWNVPGHTPRVGSLFWDVNPAIAFNPECGNFLVAGVSKTNLNIPGIEAIQSAINYTVVGDPCPSATLTVKMKGYGGKRRSIAGTGINCKKKACTGQYLPGSEVSISAWVDGSYGDGIVVSWSGCDTSRENTCNVNMGTNKNVTAKFTKLSKRPR